MSTIKTYLPIAAKKAAKLVVVAGFPAPPLALQSVMMRAISLSSSYTSYKKIQLKNLDKNAKVRPCRGGGMADTMDSKSIEGNLMRVRLPLSAPERKSQRVLVRLASLGG